MNRRELLKQGLRACEYQARPVIKVTAAHACRETEVEQRFLPVTPGALGLLKILLQPSTVALRHFLQPTGSFRRDWQEALHALRIFRRQGLEWRRALQIGLDGDLRPGSGFHVGKRRALVRNFAVSLQEYMRVGTGKAKRINPRVSWFPLLDRPWPCLGHNLHRQPFPIDCRIWCLEIEMLGDHAHTQREGSFDHSRNSGRRFEMAHIGLDRANQQWGLLVPALPVDLGRGVDLNRIPNRCAGSVRLQIVDV